MFKMEIKDLGSKLYMIEFFDQYELSSTFMRVQEFYESPLDQCKGKYFSLETFMDLYVENVSKDGNFTYLEDWYDGFNVPGDVVKDFLKIFDKKLLKKEVYFFNSLRKKINFNEDFYIIGSLNDKINPDKKDKILYNTKDHEIAHGLFYIDPGYKSEVIKIVHSLTPEQRKLYYKAFEKESYDASVFVDEINSYSATSSRAYLVDFLKSDDLPIDKILMLQRLFQKYKSKLKI